MYCKVNDDDTKNLAVGKTVMCKP